MQVRTPYFRDSIEGSLRSSADNLDIALNVWRVWRHCYEGRETWLNDVDRGRQYGADDAWGLHRPKEYTNAVQDDKRRRGPFTPGR